MIRLRSYERYTDLNDYERGVIQRCLGRNGRNGIMRKRAKRYDPRVTVAYFLPCERWRPRYPIGWAAIFPKGTLSKRRPYLQLFVAPNFRRRGIGARLVRSALTSAGLWDKIIDITTPDEGARAFYDACGWQTDKSWKA